MLTLYNWERLFLLNSVPHRYHRVMEAIGNAAGTSCVIVHALARATKNAIGFKNEIEIYQHWLGTLQVSLEKIRPIGVAETVQGGETMSEGRDRALADIIAGVQRILSRVQEDATRIRAAKAMGRIQWAIYERDRCYGSIKAIRELLEYLERAVGSRR
jgi:hypothetical protein